MPFKTRENPKRSNSNLLRWQASDATLVLPQCDTVITIQLCTSPRCRGQCDPYAPPKTKTKLPFTARSRFCQCCRATFSSGIALQQRRSPDATQPRIAARRSAGPSGPGCLACRHVGFEQPRQEGPGRGGAQRGIVVLLAIRIVAAAFLGRRRGACAMFGCERYN